MIREDVFKRGLMPGIFSDIPPLAAGRAKKAGDGPQLAFSQKPQHLLGQAFFEHAQDIGPQRKAKGRQICVERRQIGLGKNVDGIPVCFRQADSAGDL